jgi:hypothetical protein
LGENETVDSVWQLNFDTVDKDSLWGQQHCQTFDLDLDGSQTALLTTDVVLVDGHFVRRNFIAILYHRVSARTRIAEGLLVKCDIVLTSPRHAHRMILELVLLDSVTVVVLVKALAARRPDVAVRACAGVRCRALTTVHTRRLTDRLVAKRAGVAGLAATHCCVADDDAGAAMSTGSAAVRYFT